MRVWGPSSRPRRGLGNGGFTLLEILLAISIFGIAMAGLTTSQLAAIALSHSNRETAAALDAAQSTLEAIQDEDDFAQIYARWNATQGDDPVAGASPGNAFDVRGLEALSDDADGRVGEVVFPGDGQKLIENKADRQLGMPRDLNLDDKQDGADHSGDYRILPVLVRVRWRGPSGAQQLELVGTLAQH